MDIDPVEVIEELKRNKDDYVMSVFGSEYIGMIKTIQDMFEHYGYELRVTKKILNKEVNAILWKIKVKNI